MHAVDSNSESLPMVELLLEAGAVINHRMVYTVGDYK